jgi:PAS domain S-box-containing protein
MAKKKSVQNEAAVLHQQAVEKISAGEGTTQEGLSPEQTQQVIHALRGQLIELEEQNENLRQKQGKLETVWGENAPAESGSLLSQIFNMVSEIIFLLAVEPGDNFRFISVNQSFLNGTGLSVDQVVGKRYQEVIPEPAHALVLANYQKAIQEKKTVHWEETSVYPVGKRYGEVSVTPVFDEGGRCSQLIGTVLDVTGYKQAEEKINLLNRILRVISAVNQIIVRATDEASLLNEICRVIVEVGGYRLAWVGFAEQDRAKSVLPVAYFGFEEGYLAAAKITWMDTRRGRGPTGKAIRSGKTVVVQNIRNEPGYGPWRKQALQRGYAASLAVPLTVEGQCLGALNIYAAEPQAFDAGQVKLLEELAQDLAFGIAVLRARTVHEQAETWLRESEDRFKYVFDHSVIGKSITLPSGEINVNHAMCEMLGYSQEELKHRTWQTITHPEDIAVTQDAIDSLLSSQKESARFIKRYLHKNGSIVWTDVSTALRRDESGRPLYFMTSINDITERKWAEDKLEEERILLRTLIDNLPDLVYVKDSQSRKIISNMADWQASGGKTEKDVIGKTDFDTYPTELAEDYWAIDRTVIDSGISNINREEHGLDSQGNPVWILSSKVPLRDGQGKVVGLVGIGRDISERKLAEQALRESEQKYRLLVDNASEAIVVAQGGILKFANRTASDITGYSEQELTSRPFPEFIHPDDRGMVIERYMSRIKGDVDQPRYDFRLTARDGSIKWVEIGAVLIDWEGKPATLNFLKDITKRKQAEEALRALSVRQEAILVAIPDILMEVDNDKVYTWANPVGFEFFGKDVIGEEAAFYFEGEQDTYGQVKPLFSGAENVIYVESWQRRKDGEKRLLAWHCRVLKDSGGNVIGALSLAHDITESRQAEQQLAQYSEHLEEMVKERTRELSEAQEQLVRQERLAVLGQLAGGVGHELRNPLAIILNAVYYLNLVQPDADDNIKSYHSMIEHEAHTAEKIITDLLDFARIKSMEPEPVAVAGLVRQTLQRFPAPPPVEVALELPPDLPPVYADPRQMVQVLGNLTVNACQAMPTGGKLTITAYRQEQMVAIAVKDNGVGIPPENMSKLFEPLFTTKLKGIGLGLAVSQRLAEANGGRIEVESEPGKGSTFTLVLPVK